MRRRRSTGMERRPCGIPAAARTRPCAVLSPPASFQRRAACYSRALLQCMKPQVKCPSGRHNATERECPKEDEAAHEVEHTQPLCRSGHHYRSGIRPVSRRPAGRARGDDEAGFARVHGDSDSDPAWKVRLPKASRTRSRSKRSASTWRRGTPCRSCSARSS